MSDDKKLLIEIPSRFLCLLILPWPRFCGESPGDLNGLLFEFVRAGGKTYSEPVCRAVRMRYD